MIIIGADYHPSFQQIAWVDSDTGEFQEGRLEHREEAEGFYRDLSAQGVKVGVAMEASGHANRYDAILRSFTRISSFLQAMQTKNRSSKGWWRGQMAFTATPVPI